MTDATQQETITAAAANKLVFTNTALSQAAGVSGTMAVEVRDEFDNAVTSGAVSVTLASDSTGTYHFYTTGTTTAITQVTIADGESSATFDYNDEKSGTPTITGTSTGLTDATQQETITAAAANKLVFTNTALSQAAGVSGTMTVEVWDEFDNAVTSGGATVALSSDSSGTSYFYTTGTTTAITQVNIADGSSSSTFDYNDEKSGTPTITGTSTGLTDATQQQTITAAAAYKMTLEATKTTLASDGNGSATISATILDEFNNVLTSDNSTVINFSLTDSTYVALSSPTATASSGVATVTVTTKAGEVANPPATSGVNITSGSLVPPVADPDITLTIVNFSINVDAPASPFYDQAGVHLVTSGSTPKSATFSGVGGTSGNYRWVLSSVGSIDSTTGDTITYTAPASIEGTSQTDTLTLTDATDPENLTDSISIIIYNPLSITWPSGAAGIALGDTTRAVAASGGTGTYALQSTATGVATIEASTGAITPVAAGTFTAQVRDDTYGVFGTENGFHAVSPVIEIVNPIVIGSKPANNAMESGTENTFTATGGKTDGQVDWEASAGTIDSDGKFTAPTVTAGSLEVTITAYDKTYNKSHITPVKTEYTVTIYAAIDVAEKPAGYVDGTPSTYPLLRFGQASTLTAADANRSYDWIVTDWNGDTVDTQTTGAATYSIDPDVLFAANGAGIYTVTLSDQDNVGLTAGTLNVRVPMKFVAGKFAAAIVRDAGTYNDDQGTDTYTISGGPSGDVYFYTALDLSNVEVTEVNCGALADESPTDSDNVFNFTNGIPSLIGFRVKVTLDSGSENENVQRLVNAELDELWSGIFRVVPIVSFSGTVVESDGATPVAGATVTATHDATKTDTTDENGSFTIADFEKCGATYKFVVSKAGYIDKIVTDAELEAAQEAEEGIVIESAGTGAGTISGTITLSDDPTPYVSGTVAIQVKADDDYIKDSSGSTVTVFANPTDGSYTFPVPEDYTTATSFTVEAKKTGYIFDEETGLGTLTGVTLAGDPLAAVGVDLTLKPVTIITVSGTRQDSSDPESGTSYDQVLVKITAQAGLTPDTFDGTETEITVADSDGNAVTLDVFESESANTWSYTYTAYESFTITVYGDVSDDRDVDTNYYATKVWSYVKSAAEPETTTISDPNTSGGTASTDSNDTSVNLPPGGLTGDILETVTLSMVEADASDAGATAITGSEIVEIEVTDNSGENIDNTNLQRIEITLKFDPTVVTVGTLEAGTYVIYTAESLSDMAAGNATAVPTSQLILPIDYTNGYVTFWVDHLSVFGIGAGTGTTGGGSGGCFVATLEAPSNPGWQNTIALVILITLCMMILVRFRRNQA